MRVARFVLAKVPHAIALSIALSIAMAVALGATCDLEPTCECFPCGAAMSLTVLDEAGNPLNDDWVMAATVDSALVEDSVNCAPDLRLGNTCSFGTTTGVYRVVIEAPGYQTREVAARSAVASGQDCCMGDCAPQTQVVVRLMPE